MTATVDGAEACSNELEIQNSEPEVSSVILNATDNPDNTTNANLTAYVTGTDGDDDNIGYAWDWRKENMSIAVLNMNFDVKTALAVERRRITARIVTTERLVQVRPNLRGAQRAVGMGLVRTSSMESMTISLWVM
jgi:hypothetical protein